jgi:hypothetical protein
VVLGREQVVQFGEVALGVRIRVEQVVDGAPQQPQQQVAAARGAKGVGDDLLGQPVADGAVVGAERAVVRLAGDLRGRGRVLALPGLLRDGEDRVGPPAAVVGLGRQPGPQPQGQRGVRVGRGQGPAQARLHQHGGRRVPVLVDPQAAEPQGGDGHRGAVAARLGHLVGRLEPGAARPQVALDVQGLRAAPQQRPDVTVALPRSPHRASQFRIGRVARPHAHPASVTRRRSPSPPP